MSEATTVSTPAPAPTAPAEAPAKTEPAKASPAPSPAPTNGPEDATGAPLRVSKHDVRKEAAKALRERLEARNKAEKDGDGDELAAKAKPAEKPPEKSEAKPAQRAQDGKFAPKDGDKPAEKPEAAKPPERPATPPDHELKLSRALRELNGKTAEAEGHRRKVAEVTAELESFKKKFESGKSKPLDVLEELGWDYGKLTEAVVRGEVKPRAQRMELPPELQEKIERLEAAEKRREQEAQQRQYAQQREVDVGKVRSYLEANAERYPFSSSADWAAGSIVDATMAEARRMGVQTGNAETHLNAFEQRLSEVTVSLLGNERVVEALLASNPGLREKLASAMGAGTSNGGQPAASNGAGTKGADGPRTVSTLPSGSETPSAKPSKEERKREALRAWRERAAERAR